MILYEDTRNKRGKHELKHEWWSAHGVKVVRASLTAKTHEIDTAIAPAGDYCTKTSNVCVDTKRNVDEIAGNINGKQHKRFIAECRRAANAGYKLVVLVENELGYERVSDVLRWTNGMCVHCGKRAISGKTGGCKPLDPRGKCAKSGKMKPIQGTRLAKAMSTIESRYGCRFEFCSPQESAKRICDLLGVPYDD